MTRKEKKYYLELIWHWLSTIIVETNTIASLLYKLWIKSDYYKFDKENKKMIFMLKQYEWNKRQE